MWFCRNIFYETQRRFSFVINVGLRLGQEVDLVPSRSPWSTGPSESRRESGSSRGQWGGRDGGGGTGFLLEWSSRDPIPPKELDRGKGSVGAVAPY